MKSYLSIFILQNCSGLSKCSRVDLHSPIQSNSNLAFYHFTRNTSSFRGGGISLDSYCFHESITVEPYVYLAMRHTPPHYIWGTRSSPHG